MAYGQITTGSGRTLNLSPDRGWINDAGEQLVPNAGRMTLADLAGGAGQPQIDYASPIELAGFGKGYRIKGDPNAVMLADGRRARIGVDTAAEQAAQRQAVDLEGKQLQNQLTLANIAAAGRREGPTYQHVDTPNGLMAFNPRTGEFRAAQLPGGQSLQSKEQAQQSKDATAVMELTDEAKPLLQKAPGSYLGAAFNQAGRVFGLETDATNAQAQLDVLAGSLISKMPKMSGPQSDKDVQLYKAMAGNLNDPTLPASAKEAALKTLRMLNQKYATGYKGPTGADASSGPSLKAGAVEDGHVFLGGAPSNPASWKRVQ